MNVDEITGNSWTPEEKQDVTTFVEGDPAENPWVVGKPRIEQMEVVPYDPMWSVRYQHRMLRHEAPRVNLHVFATGCAEHIRHLLFRD